MDDATDVREPYELDQRDDPAGSKGVAFGVAGLTVAFFVLLPVFIVVGVYTFLIVYAIVKGVEGGSDVPDPNTVLIGIVLLVGSFTLLIAVGVMLIGRTADPKKRRNR